jgi:D-alanine-D-alanine ligase
MKILVLAGGLSPEREVSLTSGSLVADALARRGHEVCLCDLYTGRGVDGGEPVFQTGGIPAYQVGRTVPDLEGLKRETGRGECRLGHGVLSLCHKADVVFIGLHGDVGENGQLQAVLDMENILYTGSGYVGSLLAMDKDLSKLMMQQAGIPTPPWVRLSSGDSAEAALRAVEAHIGYPAVIKPSTCGSSVGVSMVENREALQDALRLAAGYGTDILAEKRIFGRELTVSILGGQVLPAVEIIPKSGFYDYQNKYQAGATTELCPAPLTEAESQRLAQLAVRGFSALRLSGYARFDFILDKEGTPFCLEANTLPGMTPTSLLPLAASAAGIDYPALCERIISLALEGTPQGSQLSL